jgi:hypothetical protein
MAMTTPHATTGTLRRAMHTLLGLFSSRAQGMQTAERLRAAGLNVETIESAGAAAETVRDVNTTDDKGDAAAPTSAAALGGLAGLGVGAIPAGLVGTLIGKGLAKQTAERYEREVAEGGLAVLVEAPEIQPAAEAETMLRAGGAVHVHTGERPTG